MIQYFEKNKSRILNMLILISPFIDLLISFIAYKHKSLSFFGTLIRGVILLFFLIYTIFINKIKNEKIYKYILVIGIYSIAFLFNRFLVYPEFAKSELVSLIKYMFFPLMILCLLVFEKDDSFISYKYLLLVSVLYLVLLFFPLITNSAIDTYSNGKAGKIGWFYSPNEISAIISILFPFVVMKALGEKKLLHKIVFMVLSCLYIYVAISTGTKTPLFAILIVLCLIVLLFFIKKIFLKKEYKCNFVNICIFLLFIIVMLFSAMKQDTINNFKMQIKIYYESVLKLLKDNDNYFINENENFESEDTGNKTISEGDNQENEIENDEESNSDTNINMIDNELIQVNDNYYDLLRNTFTETSKNTYYSNGILNLLFSSRDIYLMTKISNLSNYNFVDYLIGIGKNQRIDGTITSNTIEIDFLDVLFNFGLIGFIIYFGLIICLLFGIFKNFIKRFKEIILDYDVLALYISLILSILISCLSGHCLGAPAVSFFVAIIVVKLYKKYNNIALIKNNLNYKIYLLNFIFLICILMIVFVQNKLLKRDYSINIVYDNSNYKVVNNNLTTSLVYENEIKSEFAVDNLKIYNVSCGENLIFKYIVVERKFENGIIYNFLTAKNMTYNKLNINLNINKNVNNYNLFKEYEIEKEYSYTVGYDKTTLPSYYFEEDDESMLVYKTYIYDYKTYKYENGNYSVLKELIHEKPINTFNSKETQIELPYKSMFDQLIIVSEKPIFDEETTIEDYSNILNNGKSSVWISFDGVYSKLPYSIEPYTKDGYGRNLGKFYEKTILSDYIENSNEFYESIIMSSFHTLQNYLPMYKSGVWLTEYTSTWLKKDYETKALYFDSRHNDNISIYINDAKKHFNNETLEKWSTNYLDFIVKTYNSRYFNKLSYGVIAPDYYMFSGSSSNWGGGHSSLNHQLAIINSLFDGYVKTKIDEYKNVAEVYLQTIVNIGDKWIKENSDLWYEITPCEYMTGTDYVTLTLEDLLTTQEYIYAIYKKKNEVIDNLINSKYQYLKSIDYKPNEFINKKLFKGGYIK